MTLQLTVLQIDNRLQHDLQLQKTMLSHDARVRLQFVQRNRALTKARGWTHVIRSTGYEGIPPWWWKVFAIQEMFHLSDDPENLLILWMDTDAALTRTRCVFGHGNTTRCECMVTDPVRLAKKDIFHCMWFSPDVSMSRSPFNAGALLFRGTIAVRRLISDWVALYNPRMWKVVPIDGTHDTIPGHVVRTGLEKQLPVGSQKWVYTVGDWAGVAFKQRSFVQHILPKASVYGLRALPYYVFNEVHCTEPHRNNICVHLHGVHAVQDCEEERCVLRQSASTFGSEKKLPLLPLASTNAHRLVVRVDTYCGRACMYRHTSLASQQPPS
jgi:hypothetical protein